MKNRISASSLVLAISVTLISTPALADRDLVPAKNLGSKYGFFSNETQNLYISFGDKFDDLAGVEKSTFQEMTRLNQLNKEIRKAVQAKDAMSSAFDVDRNKLVHFSKMSQDEFVEWQKKVNPAFKEKGFNEKRFKEEKARLVAEEKAAMEEIAEAKAKKSAIFGPKADEYASSLEAHAHNLGMTERLGGYDRKLVRYTQEAVAESQANFLKAKLSSSAGKLRGRGKAGLLGAAAVGASVGYELMTSESAEASELKEEEIQANPDEERSDVGIGELDAQ